MTPPFDTQYVHQIKKGSTVKYGNKDYRIQDDGKGYLHIIVNQDGKRKKIGTDKLGLSEPVTMADYVLNWWHTLYSFEDYCSYAAAEIAWQSF